MCVRARSMPIKNQILGPEFYEKEHTKPLFKKTGILAVQNLYSYHCFMETFKILKFRTPISIHSLYKISTHNDTNIIPPSFNKQFIYQSSTIWNILKKKIGISDFSCNASSVKTNIKKIIQLNQHQHNDLIWLPSHDFDLKKVQIQKLNG